jgi:hypothetical protein
MFLVSILEYVPLGNSILTVLTRLLVLFSLILLKMLVSKLITSASIIGVLQCQAFFLNSQAESKTPLHSVFSALHTGFKYLESGELAAQPFKAIPPQINPHAKRVVVRYGPFDVLPMMVSIPSPVVRSKV